VEQGRLARLARVATRIVAATSSGRLGEFLVMSGLFPLTRRFSSVTAPGTKRPADHDVCRRRALIPGFLRPACLLPQRFGRMAPWRSSSGISVNILTLESW